MDTVRPPHLTGIASGPQPRLCSLQEALAYEDDQILYKFQERYGVTFEEARELFTETLKWLWLQVAARLQPGSPPLAMTVALVMLDEMLHTFILFTKEYTQYCDEKYGVFLHHAPMTKKAKDAQRDRYLKDPAKVLEAEAEFLSKMYSFTYELLGEETVVKWYSEYPTKYSGARMTALAEAGRRRFANIDVVEASSQTRSSNGVPDEASNNGN